MTKFTFPAYDSSMTVAELTAIYNGEVGPVLAIKKFTDKPTAIKRLAQLYRARMEAYIMAEDPHSDIDGLTVVELRDIITAIDELTDTTPAPTPAPTPEPTLAKPKKQGVGALIKGLLATNHTVEAIITEVAAKFPESAPGKDAAVCHKHINWYRSAMKKA